MGLFDVHAHLTHPRLLPEVDDVLARARAAGVTTIVCNGLNPRDNEAVLALAARDPLVKPALGFYPVDTVMQELLAAGHSYPREDEGEVASGDEGIAWLERNVEKAFAVGEIGLDGYWVDQSLWELQEQRFVRLVRLALDAGKAIIIHTRKREKRALELLRELGAKRVDWHCFGGKVALARTIAAEGHWMSIPANARRSESFTRMIETLPREKILLETDCPYLAPEKDAPSEPANVAGTLRYVAELWKVGEAEAAAQVEDNFERLFGARP